MWKDLKRLSPPVFATTTSYKNTLFESRDPVEPRIPADPEGNPGATGRGSIVKHPPERISSGQQRR